MGGQLEFPGHDVLGRLGVGPNGDVWRARRHRDGVVVALKRVPGAGPDVRDRLRRVAAVIGSSDHDAGDHLMAVHDVVSDGADVVVVRDLAAGGSLAALLAVRPAGRRLSAGEVVTVVAPLARVLAALHRRGVGHGAVTAHNVLFTPDGCPMLADVGVNSAVTGVDAPASADVRALAALGLAGLDEGGAAEVAALLRAAAAPDARGDGEALATALLATTPAEPIRLVPVESPRTTATPQTGGASTRWRWARVLTVAAGLIVAAIAIGAASAGRSSGPVAALPVLPRHEAATATVAAASLRTPHSVDAPRIVRRLEQRRLRALATGDVSALGRVYAPASLAGVTDRVTARVLARSRIRAVGLRADVHGVTVLDRSPRRLTVHVVDALSAYRLVGPHGAVVTHRPARGPTGWVLTLVRRGGWRILSVQRA